mmetsp:Transcript_92003/g.269150  ORF Transcript_92003/g.269150 Transcript_92003/m.269150 type:complete len:810 (-) Transcript_92003:91-2520(-)
MARLFLAVAVVACPAAWSAGGGAFVATEFGPQARTRGTSAAPFRRMLRRGRGRSSVSMRDGRAHSAQWWPMQELTPDRAMLVLVRHGQSEWNFANRFIGWYDSPLTEEGTWEADDAGELLRDHLLEVDEVHTSMLSRTLDTARLALAKMRDAGLQVPEDGELRSTWRLNERSYGALTGRNKKECTKEYGKDQLKLWRRSWDVPPPQYDDSSEIYQKETEAFRSKVTALSADGLFDPLPDPPPEDLPHGESLKMTQERLRPYWENTLLPSLQQGRRVMVFGHENNLRALVKMLDGISDSDILEVDIPRAMPMVYMFRRETLLKDHGIPRLEPIMLRPEDAAEGSEQLSARYLVDSELIAAFHQRDMKNVYDTSVEENLEEVCVIDEEMLEGPNMCETIGEYLEGPREEPSDRRMVIVDRRASKQDDSAPTFVVAFPLTKSRLRSSTSPTSNRASASESQATGLSRQSGGLGIGLLLAAGGLLLSPRHRRRRLGSGVVRQGSKTVITCEADSGAGAEEPDLLSLYDYEESGPDHGDEIEDEAVQGAEEEICELLGYDLGETLIRQVGRPFNDEERLEAHRASGFEHAKAAEQPQALWLIGPSASGKSTIAPVAASWVGVEDNDYVLVDGEAFRDSHLGYQEALVAGKQRGCVWWGAYVGIRENVNKEKQRMLAESVEASKNLIIPSTCLRQSQCVDVVKILLSRGYLVHIVGMYGDKEEIVSRGRKRAMDRGKRYDPREFNLALQQFAPMLRLCNGRYFMVCSTRKEDSMSPRHQGDAPLQEEEVQRLCHEVLMECNAEDCKVSLGSESDD